jgi:putative inorganic carbon (HCO3(-)) transporter
MNRALEIVLALVLAATVLNFAGVEPIGYTLMEVVLFAALLALFMSSTWSGKLEFRASIWPALFAAWIVIQMVPLPAHLVQTLEPARFQMPSAHPDAAAYLTLSIYPHATLLLWVRFLAYFAAFILAIHLFDSRRRASLLVRTLIGLGLLEAVYGSVEYLTGQEKIFTFSKQFYTGMATGTFINHNHFAGFLELTMPFLVGSGLYYFQVWQENRRRRYSGRQQPGASAGFQAFVYVFLVIVILAGLIFSRSRGGILGALISLLFIALLAQLRVRRKSWLVGLLAFIAVAAGYGLWIGLGPVLFRFEQLGLGKQEFDIATRLAFSRDAIGLLRDYPWTGTGLGTFAIAFRHYQASWVQLFVEHVHNDYVEFATDAGIPGATLLFLPIVYLLIRMIVNFLRDPRRYRSSILLGCIGSVLAILIHSGMDFNLQIPANALTLAVVLGIGYKAACVEPLTEPSERSSSREAARAVVARR